MATDSIVFELSKELNEIQFEDPDGRIGSLLSARTMGPRNVASMFGMDGCFVRLQLDKRRQIVGWTRNFVTACRYADMAGIHLADFRSRGTVAKLHKTEDQECYWNFSKEQAAKDAQDYPKAVDLLNRIAQRLYEIRLPNVTQIDYAARLRALETRCLKLEQYLWPKVDKDTWDAKPTLGPVRIVA